jgi:FtsH-binding integral membrane protein
LTQQAFNVEFTSAILPFDEGKSMSAFTTDVFERSGSDEMSRRAFYMVHGALTAWGLLLAGIVSQMTTDWKPGIVMYFVVGLGIPLLGIFMTAGGAVLSFIGYHLVVVPFGAILGPMLVQVELAHPGAVHQAFFLTAGVTVAMGASGILFPNFYRGLGGALFGALSALLVVSVIGIFVPEIGNMRIIDWIAAGLFALYIGYDMYRASSIPATLNNAIDVATAQFLNIFNLFVRFALISSDD